MKTKIYATFYAELHKINDRMQKWQSDNPSFGLINIETDLLKMKKKLDVYNDEVSKTVTSIDNAYKILKEENVRLRQELEQAKYTPFPSSAYLDEQSLDQETKELDSINKKINEAFDNPNEAQKKALKYQADFIVHQAICLIKQRKLLLGITETKLKYRNLLKEPENRNL